MAGVARFSAQAILVLAVVAVVVRIAGVPVRGPIASVPTSAPHPMPLSPIIVDPAVLRSPAKAGVQAPRATPCVTLDPRLRGGAECLKTAAPVKTLAAAPAPTIIRRILDTHGAIRFGTWFWDETGVPAGPVVITVDTKASVLSIFRGGYEIGTTAVIYGDDGMPTPLGVFPITQKDARHVSNLYHAPMPYMLRLTDDGVSIHGSAIAADYATHGCIGVPVAFARKLFGATRLGDRVIVTRGETLDRGGRITAI